MSCPYRTDEFRAVTAIRDGELNWADNLEHERIESFSAEAVEAESCGEVCGI